MLAIFDQFYLYLYKVKGEGMHNVKFLLHYKRKKKTHGWVLIGTRKTNIL